MQKGLGLAVMFVAGALVGGAAAALTTPLSGRRARRMLRKKVARGKTELERTMRPVRDHIAAVTAMAR